MDLAEFYEKVYDTVRMVPPGRVTSYGHIANLIGMPRHSRHVGGALKLLDPESDVPWQRVVSSTGSFVQQSAMSSHYPAIYQVQYHLADQVRQERDVKQKLSKPRASRFKKLGLGSLESVSPLMGGFQPQ